MVQLGAPNSTVICASFAHLEPHFVVLLQRAAQSDPRLLVETQKQALCMLDRLARLAINARDAGAYLSVVTTLVGYLLQQSTAIESRADNIKKLLTKAFQATLKVTDNGALMLAAVLYRPHIGELFDRLIVSGINMRDEKFSIDALALMTLERCERATVIDRAFDRVRQTHSTYWLLARQTAARFVVDDLADEDCALRCAQLLHHVDSDAQLNDAEALADVPLALKRCWQTSSIALSIAINLCETLWKLVAARTRNKRTDWPRVVDVSMFASQSLLQATKGSFGTCTRARTFVSLLRIVTTFVSHSARRSASCIQAAARQDRRRSGSNV